MQCTNLITINYPEVGGGLYRRIENVDITVKYGTNINITLIQTLLIYVLQYLLKIFLKYLPCAEQKFSMPPQQRI